MGNTDSVATVCIATYKRPDGLERLLRSLAEVAVPDGWQLRVVIADNDSEGSAATTLASLNGLGLDLVYAIEPRQGIPFARNCTTELALARGTDELIFVDDDEWVESDWLHHLISGRQRHNSPIVMGSVIAEYEQTPPRWATEIDAFQRKIRPDGTELDFAITSNTIVDSMILAENHRPFEESLRYGGGSDLHLFQQLNREGHRIVSVPDARVHELVPNSRISKSWLFRRQYRRGLNRSTTLRLLNFGVRTGTKRLAAAGYEMAAGTAIVIVGIIKGESTRVRGRMRAAYGLGLLVGLTGRQYEEYRTTHGS